MDLEKKFRLGFRIAAASFFVAAFYHLYVLVFEAWDTRHAVFMLISAVMGVLCLTRSKLLPVLLGVLTLQQLYSHGYDVLSDWREFHRVDWVSVSVCIFFPIVFYGTLMYFVWAHSSSSRIPKSQ